MLVSSRSLAARLATARPLRSRTSASTSLRPRFSDCLTLATVSFASLMVSFGGWTCFILPLPTSARMPASSSRMMAMATKPSAMAGMALQSSRPANSFARPRPPARKSSEAAFAAR